MKTSLLGDLLDHLIDHRGKTPKKLGADFVASGVPVASAQLVADGRLDLTACRFVDTSVAARWMPIPLREGDVLLTSEAPLGRVAWVESDAPLVLGQRLFALRPKQGVLHGRYLGYWLMSANGQAALAARQTGSTVSGIRQSALRQVEVPLPPWEVQHAIAEVLGALDDKIAANRRLLRILHTLASSFVDEAISAASTTDRELGDLAVFHNRKRIPLSKNERGSRPGRVPYYGATGVVDHVDSAIFDEPLVLIGEDGTVTTASGMPVVQYIWGPSWVNNHAHVLTGSVISTEVLRYLVRRVTVADRVTGAVQPKLSMTNLKPVRIPTPSENRLPLLEHQIGALTKREVAAADENQRLAATRDELLPLLMSRRITVKDAEDRVGKEV